MKDLIRMAKEAMTRAYAPYSKMRIGVAIRTKDGGTFVGCNVENASLGLTVCAERSAVCAMVAAGARKIRTVAIAPSSGRWTPPCGACRQVLAEFGDTATRVVLIGKRGTRIATLGQLLPNRFELRT